MSADRFLEIASRAALQAGAVAMRLQGEARRLDKEGSTPEARALTIADLACQDILLVAMREAFPEAAVDAEESDPRLRSFPPEEEGRPLVVVDPIDGTLNYAEGSDDFAVMIGWCEAGRYEACVVHFPAHHRTFAGRAGRGVRERLDDGSWVEASTDAPRVVTVTRGVPPEVCGELAGRGWEVVRTRCSAVDGAACILGRARAALSVGRPGRRRAIPCLATLEAGGIVLVGGEPWQRRDPRTLPPSRMLTLAAADEETAAEVQEALGSLDLERS